MSGSRQAVDDRDTGTSKGPPSSNTPGPRPPPIIDTRSEIVDDESPPPDDRLADIYASRVWTTPDGGPVPLGPGMPDWARSLPRVPPSPQFIRFHLEDDTSNSDDETPNTSVLGQAPTGPHHDLLPKQFSPADASTTGQGGMHVKGDEKRRGEKKAGGGYGIGNMIGEPGAHGGNSRSSSAYQSHPEEAGKKGLH